MEARRQSNLQAGELLQVLSHILLGEILEQRMDLVLESGLDREDHVVGGSGGSIGSEILGVGNVHEALTVLQRPVLVDGLLCLFGTSSENGTADGLTRRSSHFSSSVTHLVVPGDSSMRYFSTDSPLKASGYSSTLLPSFFSTKRAATAGASSATTEEVLSFMLIRKRTGIIDD